MLKNLKKLNRIDLREILGAVVPENMISDQLVVHAKFHLEIHV